MLGKHSGVQESVESFYLVQRISKACNTSSAAACAKTESGMAQHVSIGRSVAQSHFGCKLSLATNLQPTCSRDRGLPHR